MSLSEMQVFNEYYMEPTIETLGQMLEVFNERSNGTIRLTTDGFSGDFQERSFWSAVHSARRRVNRYGANGAVAATDLAQLKESSVKVAGGFGPIRYEPSQMTWLQKPTVEAIEVASQNFAEAMLQDMVDTSLAALVGAINNVGATAARSVAATASYAEMNNTHALFGDSSGSLACSVMNGTVAHQLIGANLANAERLFESQGVLVIDILGKPVLITDSASLSVAGTPNKYAVLSLTEGAATVFDGGDVIGNIDTSNGNQRIETTMQVDYTFGLALKGYTWDTANGGKSPDDAALGTGSNWDKTLSEIKQTAGVLTLFNQS